MHTPIYKNLDFLCPKGIDAIVTEEYIPDDNDLARMSGPAELGIVIATVFFKSGLQLKFLSGRDRINNYKREASNGN